MRGGPIHTERIGEVLEVPTGPNLGELLIDCEEDRTLRAVLVGMLREVDGALSASIGSSKRIAAGSPKPLDLVHRPYITYATASVGAVAAKIGG